MADTSLSSRPRRRSWTVPGLKVATSFRRASLTRLGKRFASMSQRVLISTFFSLAKPRLRALPWPRMPTLASTTRSLAPRTRLPTVPLCARAIALPPSATPATAVAVRDTKSRLVMSSGSLLTGGPPFEALASGMDGATVTTSARDRNGPGESFISGMARRRRILGAAMDDFLPITDEREVHSFLDQIPLRVDRARFTRFVLGFPHRYLELTPPVEMVAHFALVSTLGGRAAASRFAREGEGWKLVVAANDRSF